VAGVVVVDLTAKDGVSPVLGKVQAGAKALNSKLNTLSGTLARIGTAALVKGFVSAGVEADRTGKRLKLLSGAYGETARLQSFAAEAAQKFTIGQTAAASAATDLYGRLRPMGISLNEIETVFNGVNVASSKMNLSAADTEGVMLQLSQALGSGVLQGDEFRSIMERLPAIGQAVADSMGVQVSQLKSLSSAGKITTAEIIKALEGLSKQEPPQADAFKAFQKAMADLSTTMGTELLPAVTPIVQALGGLITAFGQLPGPAKTLIAAIVGLGAAFVVLAPAIAAAGPALTAIAGLKIGATIAGWLPVVVKLGAVIKAFGIAVAGVLSGPVGIVLLLVAAGAAIYAFRDQIAEALKPIGDFFMAAFNIVGNVLTKAAQFYMNSYVKPVLGFGQKLFDGFVGLFTKIADVVKAPFLAVVNFIKGIFNNVLATIGKGVNGAIGIVNRLISAFNRLPAPNIPLIPQMTVPQFAKGGVVNGPTLAMVGEGGEPEYIIPQSKAAGFANNFLSGSRGSAAIPQFADGGFVGPINIQTGPVMQQDNQTYLTIGQFEEGMRELTESIARGGRSYGSRQFQGVS
tara:strand:+ start:1878 stop:3599 length:1722 start_codon:yes stop_codon:yes gene_type:complete